jgi:hypothetical protein
MWVPVLEDEHKNKKDPPACPIQVLTRLARLAVRLSDCSLQRPVEYGYFCGRSESCRNQRSCLGAYSPWLISQFTVPLQQQQALNLLGWVGMARVVLLRVCPSLHPLQTLLCAAFCASEAAVSGLLPVARDQCMLVPVGALRRMLLAIACLGHIQLRPGSDLPQLRAGVLHWLTSPGLPAVEVFELTSHLVWTHQTTDDLVCCRVLNLPSLFATPTLSSFDYDGRHAVRPIAGLLSKHYDTVQPRGSRSTRLSPASSVALAGCGASRGRLGTRKSSGAWLPMALGRLVPMLFLSPMPLWCCGLRRPWGWRTAAAACFLGVCDCSGCPHSGAARVGGSSATAVAPVAG